MPDAPTDTDVARLGQALNDLITRDLTVTGEWRSETELDADPALVTTLSVQPPRGAGVIRLIRMADGAQTIALHPGGGTHVRRSFEIGSVDLGRIEKQGRQTRRVTGLLS